MAKTRVATRGLRKRRAYRSRVKKSSCRGKRGRTCNKTKGCKYTRGKKRKYCRKKKNTRLSMKGGKRRKTRKRRRRRKRQRGGSGCPYEKNMGEYFTLRPYNNLSGGDPARSLINSNANNKVPIPYKTSGGGKRKRRSQKGGSAFQKTGLGDLGQLYYSVGNGISNFGNTWRGKTASIGGNVMDQPELLKASDYRHAIPDVKSHHKNGVVEAAGKGTSA
jgi:hypothetical protein